MKNKISILSVSLLLVCITSCKKESSSNLIIGQWVSTAVYKIEDTGTSHWVPIDGLARQFYTFSTDGKFGSRTDVPGGGGSYNYDHELQELILNYEPNQYLYINSTSVELTVEMITNEKLILSAIGPPLMNAVYKTEYSRIN